MHNATPEQLKQRLEQLTEQLQQALKSHDWDAVAAIDLGVRACLQAMPDLASAELLAAKQQLHALYGRVLPAYAEACNKLRELLLTHIDYAEGRSAYMRTDLLQGEK